MTVTIDVGMPGPQGQSAYAAWLAAGNTGTQAQFLASLIGPSAYQNWLSNGNTGTLAQFLASLIGPQGNAAIGGKWQPNQPARLVNVGTRCCCPADYLPGSLQSNSRSIHTARETLTHIGVELANWFVTSARPPLGERGTSAGVTVYAGLEYPLGVTNTPFTFNGANSGYAYDYSSVVTDMLACNIPAGAQYAIVVYRVCDAGGGVTLSSDNLVINTNAGHCFEYAASGLTNRSRGVGSFASTSTLYDGPLAIFAISQNPSPIIIGDSIAHGFNDDGANNLDVGILARSIGKTRPYINLAFTGEETLNILDTAQGFALRSAVIQKYGTHVYDEYGVNDLYLASAHVQQLASRLKSLRLQYPNHWWYRTTLTPETAPGTPSTPQNVPDHIYMNNILRGPTNWADAVYDVASVLEASRNSEIWKTQYAGPDGIHPNPAGYAAVAAAGVVLVP